MKMVNNSTDQSVIFSGRNTTRPIHEFINNYQTSQIATHRHVSQRRQIRQRNKTYFEIEKP